MSLFFSAHAALLLGNLVVGVLYLFVGGDSGQTFGLALIYWALYTPLSFICWFRPAYKAFRYVSHKYNKYFNQPKYEGAAENYLDCVYISFTLYIFRDDSSFNFMVSKLCFNKLLITFNSFVFFVINKFILYLV